MARRLVHLLRQDRGVAALETLLSVPIIFCVLMLMWSAMIVVYNQATLNTATQGAAQGAITVFDRTTYRAPGSGYSNPNALAANAAKAIYAENSRGMLNEQFGSAKSKAQNADDITVQMWCSADIGAPETPCRTNEGAPVERARVFATAQSGYWLLSPLANKVQAGDSDCKKTNSDTCEQGSSAEVSHEQHSVGMNSTGNAISVGPN